MKNLNEENKNIENEQEENKKRGIIPIIISIAAIIIGIFILVALNNVNTIKAVEPETKAVVEKETTTKSEKATTMKAKEKTTKAEKETTTKAKEKETTVKAEETKEAAQQQTEVAAEQQPQTEAYVEPQTQAQPQQAAQKAAPAHEHNWVAVTEVVHHPAVTHEETVYKTVHHDAVTEQRDVIEYHTVCDTCGAVIGNMSRADAAAHVEAHMLAGEGSGYGTSPVVVGTETVVIQQAYDEQVPDGTKTVTDSNAWDETITTGYKCSSCGATK